MVQAAGAHEYWTAQREVARRAIEAADAQEALGAAQMRAAQIARASGTLHAEIAQLELDRMEGRDGRGDDVPFEELLPEPMRGSAYAEATADEGRGMEFREDTKPNGEPIVAGDVSPSARKKGAPTGASEAGGAAETAASAARCPGPATVDANSTVAEVFAAYRADLPRRVEAGELTQASCYAATAKARRVAEEFGGTVIGELSRGAVEGWCGRVVMSPGNRQAALAGASQLRRFAGIPWRSRRGSNGSAKRTRNVPSESVDGGGDEDGAGGGVEVEEPVEVPERAGADGGGAVRAAGSRNGRGGDYGAVRAVGKRAVGGRAAANDPGVTDRLRQAVTLASTRVFSCDEERATRGTAPRRCLTVELTDRGWDAGEIAALIGVSESAIPTLLEDGRRLRRHDPYHAAKCTALRGELKRVGRR